MAAREDLDAVTSIPTSWAWAAKAVFGLVVGTLLSVAALGFMMVRADLKAVEVISRDGALWSVTQLENEHSNALLALSAVDASWPPRNADIVGAAQAIDLLWSRTEVFAQGNLGARLRSYDEARSVARLRETLDAVEIYVAAMKAGEPGAARDIFNAIKPFGGELKRLTSRTNAREVAEISELTGAFQTGGLKALMTVGAAFLVLAMFAAFAQMEARRNRRLAARVISDADLLRKAHKVNERFLTTMNHEFRTPMNGVLGLIALAKRDTDEKGKSELLDKAEWSANRLLGMLSDAFEFADEHSRTVTPHPTLFRLHDVVSAIERKAKRDAAANGVDVTVVSTDEPPNALIGDAALFSDAVVRFLIHVFEGAGVERVAVEVACRQEEIIANLRIVHAGDSGASLSDHQFIGEVGAGDRFEAVAVGPALARHRLSAIDGIVKVERVSAGVTSLIVTAPVKLAVVGPSVRVDVASGAMRLLCENALKSVGAIVVADNENEHVDAVIVEPSSLSDDADESTVQAMRMANPGASLIAAGRPRRPELYDAAVTLPNDAGRLGELLVRGTA